MSLRSNFLSIWLFPFPVLSELDLFCPFAFATLHGLVGATAFL